MQYINDIAIFVMFSLRIIGAIIFLAAACHKLFDIARSIETVRSYALLPSAVAPIAGIILPCVELAIGVGLLFESFFLTATAVAAILLFLFLLAQLSILARGLKIGCGCFGSGDAEADPVRLATLARTGSILLLFGIIAALNACSAGDRSIVISGMSQTTVTFLCQLTSVNLVVACVCLRTSALNKARPRDIREG